MIRFQSISPTDKKIIGTKKIETKRLDFNGMEMAPGEQKQYLTQEITILEAQLSKLQDQLKAEQEEAQTAINHWWQEKQQEAEQEAQRLADEAAIQGFQAGFEQGVQQAEEDYRQKQENMRELLELAYAEKKKIIQQAEPFLLELSVKVAGKVIKGELKQHEEQLLNVVKQALLQIEESEDVLLQISSEDYPIILPFIEELKTYVRADSQLKIIPVATLSKGDCMIHTASGSYDATIDGQLIEIKKQLLIYFEEKTNDDLAER
ncbi:FliH/SctL family protein [Planococcus shixiaomingii]|uniref:FliH/SctL family protein n=1 Tax=Planococcus shixiaomingii TaxID=3058393 RepID=UPI002627B87D|nr:FliH/SctL family protein [Planococcus sp. N022]WKA56775.1 FliH/SctL family protein [Planococcus sp. N022]